MKNSATGKVDEFSVNALLRFPFDNSQNPLVIPQTGHSTPNNRSIRQKCGISFKKSTTEFLNNINVPIKIRLLNSMLISFCLRKSVDRYFNIHLGIIEISIF